MSQQRIVVHIDDGATFYAKPQSNDLVSEMRHISQYGYGRVVDDGKVEFYPPHRIKRLSALQPVA